MGKRKLHRPIDNGKYRVKRFYLSDEAFADPGPKRSNKRTDLLGKEAWGHLMVLPTDVLLRTTDHLGTMIEDMQEQSKVWWNAFDLDESKWPFFHDAYLDVMDEFDAAPFIAAHGFYRQATAGLRNALEVMTNACRYAVADDEIGYKAWRENLSEPPKFGNSADIIGHKPAGRGLDQQLAGQGLFKQKPDGVLRALYHDVCRYAHSRPGFSNGSIWQSNGPVFVPRAFTQFWLDFCDTSLACFVLLKLADPSARGHQMFESIAGNTGASWHGLAPATVSALKLAE